MVYQSIRKGSFRRPQTAQKTSRFALDRPFAPPRRRLAQEAPQTRTIQRKLKEIAEEKEDVAYTKIRSLAEEYNTGLEEGPANVVNLLHLLDQIDKAASQWLGLYVDPPVESEESADFRKWTRIQKLQEEVKVERASLVEEPARVMPGLGAILPKGSTWHLYSEKKETWVDASSITESEALEARITAEQDDEWLFTVDKGKSKGKAKKDQVTLGSRFKDMKLTQLYPSGTPEPKDVLQSNLGDCYLQAALASIAAQQPASIMNQMIYDAGDKVVVRLYKLPELTPKNIVVEKSIPETTEDQELYNRGALWVKMIQKAYAASGLAQNLFKSLPRSYEEIGSGGNLPGYALGVLLGKKVESHAASGKADLLEEDSDSEEEAAIKSPWADEMGTYNLYRQYKKTPDLVEPSVEDQQYIAAEKYLGSMFKNAVEDMDAWATFAEENQSKLEDFESIEELENLFAKKSLPKRLGEVILRWAGASGRYRGAVGSGVYSQGQQELLTKIDKALKAHRIVVTGTKKEAPEDTGVVGSSGEPKYKGLAFGHAYTVLAVRANATKNPDSEEKGPHSWLKIRNPWGYYGRSYETGDEVWKAQEVPMGTGISWIEPNDFSANFKEVQFV